MIKTLTLKLAKGMQNNIDLGNKMTWWKINFNMPWKNFFSNITVWTPNNGPINYFDVSTYPTVPSYNLTGFRYGFEIVGCSVIYRWENNSGGPYTLNADLYARWTDTDGATTMGNWIMNGYHESHTIAAGGWWEIIGNSNIGTAWWEIDQNANYHLRANALGTDGMALKDMSFGFTNVPTTPSLLNKESYIWVEGNNLCYIDAHYWKRIITGNIVGFAGLGTKGSIWIDPTNYLHWVGDNNYDYKCPWAVKQFANPSFVSGEPTSAVFAGVDKAGSIWIDHNFGGTHLAYIGADGWKYLAGDGNNPYV